MRGAISRSAWLEAATWASSVLSGSKPGRSAWQRSQNAARVSHPGTCPPALPTRPSADAAVGSWDGSGRRRHTSSTPRAHADSAASACSRPQSTASVSRCLTNVGDRPTCSWSRRGLPASAAIVCTAEDSKRARRTRDAPSTRTASAGRPASAPRAARITDSVGGSASTAMPAKKPRSSAASALARARTAMAAAGSTCDTPHRWTFAPVTASRTVLSNIGGREAEGVPCRAKKYEVLLQDAARTRLGHRAAMRVCRPRRRHRPMPEPSVGASASRHLNKLRIGSVGVSVPIHRPCGRGGNNKTRPATAGPRATPPGPLVLRWDPVQCKGQVVRCGHSGMN
eukprot:scaffold4124_cov109-Isochrysis_galbana.AAC.3